MSKNRLLYTQRLAFMQKGTKQVIYPEKYIFMERNHLERNPDQPRLPLWWNLRYEEAACSSMRSPITLVHQHQYLPPLLSTGSLAILCPALTHLQEGSTDRRESLPTPQEGADNQEEQTRAICRVEPAVHCTQGKAPHGDICASPSMTPHCVLGKAAFSAAHTTGCGTEPRCSLSL